MTAILGISAYYHDSAAALVIDGRIVAAAQEERFTRKKHDDSFPAKAVEYCLAEAGISPAELDHVGFYDKPLLKFDRLLETYLTYAPAGFQSFVKAMPVWLREKLHLPREMRKRLPGYKKRFVFLEHHESHAASAFFPSPFESAAILTIDGVGEWATASIGRGKGNQIELISELRFPHSLGLLYSAFTYYCGFRVNSGEYKLMGLAPYGEPKYVDLIKERLIDLKPDGSLRMDMSYFNYCQGLTMTSAKFHRLFSGEPRRPESPITEREMDIAASIQKVTEETMLRMARHALQVTGERNLCLAGGVALNCVGNGKILAEGVAESIWIQPAAGDAGGSLGTALFIWHQLLENERTPTPGDSQQGTLLGPQFSDREIRQVLDEAETLYERFDDGQLCKYIAELIGAGKVVAWFSGRMEFGPRALGARSILGDARRPEMQSLINQKVKLRESFRPFAPAVLSECASEYFDFPPETESPYMMLVAPVRENKRRSLADDSKRLLGLDQLQVERSVVPAITHVDYSARVQTVDERRNPRFYRLLKAFYEKTGCAVMINTSFNVRGEPIVCTPQDALRCFQATNIDVLVVENYVLLKQPRAEALTSNREQYLAEFQLD
ncbi:MAG TPA: carbamoyltransferase [Pirellulaceae bacterium]